MLALMGWHQLVWPFGLTSDLVDVLIFHLMFFKQKCNCKFIKLLPMNIEYPGHNDFPSKGKSFSGHLAVSSKHCC